MAKKWKKNLNKWWRIFAVEDKTDTYVGIADCHGIESFNLKQDTTNFDQTIRVMRADANRHRHAVYYEADLDQPAVKLIRASLDAEDFAMALEWLKRMSLELRSLPKHESSWKLIPNEKLDPYR